MIIQPKTRGFISLTAHPKGCEGNVKEQIAFAEKHKFSSAPKNVLVIGASTGYGLASRIALAFGGGANTIGVFFERPSEKDKPASAGWYNSVAFKKFAEQSDLSAENINGDAFSSDVKEQVIDLIRQKYGKIDCVVYSLASPKRTDPFTGEVFKSVLKPIGEPFTGKTVNVDKDEVYEITIEPATAEEVQATEKVMGGEDWELWMQALHGEKLLANGVKTIAYSYIGPEITWPIYANGTIGAAKDDLMRAREAIKFLLGDIGGQAIISVNKAVVTQASAAIPVVPLYISILFKVMKEKRIHEGCIEQMVKLFSDRLYGPSAGKSLDEQGRIRLDEFELHQDIQDAVAKVWPKISTENLKELSDIDGYKQEFLKLFGFGLSSVDYSKDVEV
ncbi:MAG: trans-2-enoyl-CoA reductase family protein [Puniceicoccales bacterium]|jgi:enoyl-[acyl-carrier protein] reductase/trans-2-enoyl-CoA reductase (NAD+)|nr:trans-2-enoyl-CoA reductase family protein [Puniceicoccales bacterium]